MIHFILIIGLLTFVLTASFSFTFFFLRVLISRYRNFFHIGLSAILLGFTFTIVTLISIFFFGFFIIESVASFLFFINIPLFILYLIKLFLRMDAYFFASNRSLRILNQIHFVTSTIVFGFYYYYSLLKFG